VALSPGPHAAYREGVRAHGVVDDVPPAGPADHLCWVYEDDADFAEAARQFLAGGLARGERLLCVGERVIDSLRTTTPPELDLPALIARGAVETVTLDEAYAAAGSFDPERQLAYYDAATRRALDDGFRGLRVIADVSTLAADPAQRAELMRWEHLADDYAVHGAGFAAMCAYRADLGPDALADIAAVHPRVHGRGDVSSFRLFVDGDRLVLAGTLDTLGCDRLARVLAATAATDGGVVLELAGVEFIDIAGCRALARWAATLRGRSVPVQLTGASALLRRMWEILDLGRVAPVTFGEAAA
jgi:anti-anti-sigma regulatory factor